MSGETLKRTRVTVVFTEDERAALIRQLGGDANPPAGLAGTRAYLSALRKIRDARVARWGRSWRAARAEAKEE